MSDQAQQRLKLTLNAFLTAGILALLVGLIMPSAGIAPAAAQEEPEAISVEEYEAIQKLRDDLRLTPRHLAAIGCSQHQAESVLVALKQWYEANKAARTVDRQEEIAASKQLRDSMRRVHQGPRDESLLAQVPQLRQNARAAAQARRQGVDAAIPTITAGLDAEQRERWQTLLDNRGAPGLLEFVPGLRDAEVANIERALATRTRRNASTGDVMHPHLSVSQLSAISAFSERVAAHLHGVLLAEEAQLPMPQELREQLDVERDGMGEEEHSTESQ